MITELLLAATAVHLALTIWAIFLILKLDVSGVAQKRAQIILCAVIPILGPLVIGLFNHHEAKHHHGVAAKVKNDPGSVNQGMDLYISHRQTDQAVGSDESF